MIAVPIGVDCGLSELLQANNLRHFATPFDWCVTYNGVANIIRDNFQKFILPPGQHLNLDYDVSFPHDFGTGTYEIDKEKYIRRIERFQAILSGDAPLLFIRKGHGPHLHKEHNGRFTAIKSDLQDAEELDDILKIRYPQLKYTIVVILVCGACFDAPTTYISKHENIKIFNIANPIIDDVSFQLLFQRLFIANV